MSERHHMNSYPLRMDPEVRQAAQTLALKNERSLNWQINHLVKLGLQQLSSQKDVQNAAH
jgi:hypothetical protein